MVTSQVEIALVTEMLLYFLHNWWECPWIQIRGLFTAVTSNTDIWLCFAVIFRSLLMVLRTFFSMQMISEQFSSVAQSCLNLGDPMNRSTPVLPVHHQLLEFTQTHVHCVSDATQPSHPLSSPSPGFILSWHQSLFKWVSSLQQVAKVLECQLQHQSFQWTSRTDLL